MECQLPVMKKRGWRGGGGIGWLGRGGGEGGGQIRTLQTKLLFH